MSHLDFSCGLSVHVLGSFFLIGHLSFITLKKLFNSSIYLIYNIILVSRMQHSDSVFLYIRLHLKLLQNNGYCFPVLHHLGSTLCFLMATHYSQSCPIFCDYSPPGSSAHGIFQAKILERVAISYSEDLPNPGIGLISRVSPALAGGFFTTVPPRNSCFSLQSTTKQTTLSTSKVFKTHLK